MAGKTRVFIACSLDGYVAGPNDELDWLEGHEGAEDTFAPFYARVGAVLMGRRTYDVVTGFDDGQWMYGDTPLLVPTRRPLESGRSSVRAVSGSIADVVAQARRAADGKDVYIDGGALIRSALDAGLVDEMTVTLIPWILGDGIPLFAGTQKRHRLELVGARELGGGLVQTTYRPHPDGRPGDDLR